jgi:DNA-binding CsgD family transcriptional regulator
MARLALEALLAQIDSPAFIVSESGTIMYENPMGKKMAAGCRYHLRGELVAAIRGLHDPASAGAALVTPLRGQNLPTYFLIVFRAPGTFEANVAYAAKLWGLTPRQAQVLALLAEGFSNKTIAVRLRCALRTVEQHLTTIFDKSGLTSRTALVAAMARAKPARPANGRRPITEDTPSPRSRRRSRADSKVRRRAAGDLRSRR